MYIKLNRSKKCNDETKPFDSDRFKRKRPAMETIRKPNQENENVCSICGEPFFNCETLIFMDDSFVHSKCEEELENKKSEENIINNRKKIYPWLDLELISELSDNELEKFTNYNFVYIIRSEDYELNFFPRKTLKELEKIIIDIHTESGTRDLFGEWVYIFKKLTRYKINTIISWEE